MSEKLITKFLNRLSENNYTAILAAASHLPLDKAKSFLEKVYHTAPAAVLISSEFEIFERKIQNAEC